MDSQKPVITTSNPLEPEEFRRQAHLVIDFLVDYYKNLENYPVQSQVGPGYLSQRIPQSAPHEPEPIEDILRDVRRDIIPGLTHWQSPKFFGYFPCNLSIPGLMGEMLCSGFNVQAFAWICSPAATELETAVMDWIGNMLQLPADFLFSGGRGGGGVIHGTTCEAILSTLVAARDKMLKNIGSHNINKLVVYGSDQTHSTLKKAAQIAGIHRSNFRAVATKKADAFALTAEALREAMEADVSKGLVPLFLCATVGTTPSTAVDPLGPLASVAKEFGVWVHVDGAYAVSACICPEFRHFIDGVENTDSFTFNPHKWLFTGTDCCCLWVKNTAALVESLSTNPEYLRNKASESKQVVDYKDWQIPLSRRFRSIRLWVVLRSFGVRKLRELLRSHVKMAEDFEGLIKTDKRFQVVVPRNFSTVCFHISPQTSDEEMATSDLNAKLLESMNESGKILMTHAVIGGVYVIRIAIGGSLTRKRHINHAWEVVQGHANALLASSGGPDVVREVRRIENSE